MSFGESVFSAGFIQKTVKWGLFIKGNYHLLHGGCMLGLGCVYVGLAHIWFGRICFMVSFFLLVPTQDGIRFVCLRIFITFSMLSRYILL